MALRGQMARDGVDGLLVPRADEHLSEYVPPSAERLAWLTGFTGSAGLAVLLTDRAAVFTDGRYTLQLDQQTDAALYERLHTVQDPAPAWVLSHAPQARIGYDPWLMSEDAVAKWQEAGIPLVPLPHNPIDAVWPDRPPPPSGPAVPHSLRWAGASSADKRAQVAQALREARQDAAFVTDPASVAWLLNIRGADVAFTPFALGFLLLRADASAVLVMAPAKLGTETRAWLTDAVRCVPPGALPELVASLTGARVRVDPAGSPAWFAQALRAAGATVVAGADPCALPKACKNDMEQAGARAAHARDAVALCRFLCWFDTDARGKTEMQAAAHLLACRADAPEFRGESFPAIAGSGPHGAIIHYRVTPETDRVIGPDETFLIDSGAQYPDGTTDVTRTLWTGPGDPPAALRDRVTRVLKGHIALATARFPKGVAGPHLDAFARRALWDAGLDYDHGTGHGVGSYLSVHEGPASISRTGRMTALAPGMILSNEPGFYLPGAYGIRLENLLLVQAAEGEERFLAFETLTLAPFDRRLIEPALLSVAEAGWLQAYHARVLAEVGPLLDPATRDWLRAACDGW